MPLQLTTPIPWAEAAGHIERLAGLFDPSRPFAPGPVRLAGRRVTAALKRLPLTQAQMCYFRNRVESCRWLYAVREWGAARYQLRELARKVRHLETAWGLAVPAPRAHDGAAPPTV
jgi:hypothetical protein